MVCICAHEECRRSFERREMLIDVIVVRLNIMFIIFYVLQIELFVFTEFWSYYVVFVTNKLLITLV